MTKENLKRFFDFSSGEKNRTIGLCQLCKKNYRDLNGIYSNFLKHLKRKHPNEYQRTFIQQHHDDDDDDFETDNHDVKGEDGAFNDQNESASKQARINLSIAKNLIIKCNLPFSMVENASFRDFMKDIAPKWKPISSRKLKTDIIVSMKDRVHKIIYDQLEKVSDLTLTIDAWSDRRGRGFLGVTCHFIDEEMIPQAMLIEFVRMKSPHSSETIFRYTDSILDKFNIKHKIYKIITDNASTMIKAYKFGLVIDDNTIQRNSQSSNDSIDIG